MGILQYVLTMIIITIGIVIYFKNSHIEENEKQNKNPYLWDKDLQELKNYKFENYDIKLYKMELDFAGKFIENDWYTSILKSVYPFLYANQDTMTIDVDNKKDGYKDMYIYLMSLCTDFNFVEYIRINGEVGQLEDNERMEMLYSHVDSIVLSVIENALTE